MTRPRQPRTRIELRAADRTRRLRRSLAADIRDARRDSGLSLRGLAGAAGVSASTLREIEADKSEPSLHVLARVGEALGMDLAVRLYPGTGPLVRDHHQASMLEGLLVDLHARWHPTAEMWVTSPVKGVIDLVLEPEAKRDGQTESARAEPLIAVEAQSELRRLEQQVRWSRAKAEALEQARGRPVSRLLLLRSTRRTRAVVAEHARTLRMAYPERAADAYAALTSGHDWPGASILWCDVVAGHSTTRAVPPRHITVGR